MRSRRASPRTQFAEVGPTPSRLVVLRSLIGSGLATSTSFAARWPRRRPSWRSPRSTPPIGQRYLLKPYPKDNEPSTVGVPQAWLDNIAEHIRVNGISHVDLVFPSRAGAPISRNTFRTRIWLPAVKASGIDFGVRVHDLRHAQASWLLAGAADLKSVMGAWATRRSSPPRSTRTRSPTPTNAPSTHSPPSSTYSRDRVAARAALHAPKPVPRGA